MYEFVPHSAPPAFAALPERFGSDDSSDIIILAVMRREQLHCAYVMEATSVDEGYLLCPDACAGDLDDCLDDWCLIEKVLAFGFCPNSGSSQGLSSADA